MTILYVNGDSHTAAAEAVNAHAFAEDDDQYNFLGRLPHPDNLSVSWGNRVATALKYGFKCDAESAASNQRIMRTTREWVKHYVRNPQDVLLIIQWSTWERQEWLIDNRYYQINASGVDSVPDSYQDAYKKYIADINWKECTRKAHNDIWEFHQELEQQNISHVFFNGNNHFESIETEQRHNWGLSYVSPYNSSATYSQWLIDNGYETVAPDSWHFGQDAHGAWAKFMLQYIVNNKMV